MTTAFWIMLAECYGLIIGFLCYAALLPVWRDLSMGAKVVFSPLAMFYLVDVATRCTVGWLLFLQPPTWSDRTITYLCNSHVNDPNGASWRDYKRTTARGICRTLNIIQKKHCPALQS